MKTYIYQDEKSHKFWAVEQQDNELHISWGKVGTNGQSQVKKLCGRCGGGESGTEANCGENEKGVCGTSGECSLETYSNGNEISRII